MPLGSGPITATPTPTLQTSPSPLAPVARNALPQARRTMPVLPSSLLLDRRRLPSFGPAAFTRRGRQHPKRIVMNPPASFLAYAASLQPSMPVVSGPLSIGQGGQAIMALPSPSDGGVKSVTGTDTSGEVPTASEPSTSSAVETNENGATADNLGGSGVTAGPSTSSGASSNTPEAASSVSQAAEALPGSSDTQSASTDSRTIELGVPTAFISTSAPDQPAAGPLVLSGTAPVSLSPSEAVIGSSPILSLVPPSQVASADDVGTASTASSPSGALSDTPMSAVMVLSPTEAAQSPASLPSDTDQAVQTDSNAPAQEAVSVTTTADDSASTPGAIASDSLVTSTPTGTLSALSSSGAVSASTTLPSASRSAQAAHAGAPFTHSPFFIVIMVIAGLSAVAILATVFSFCLRRRAGRHVKGQFSEGLSDLVQDLSRTPSMRSVRSRRSNLSVRGGLAGVGMGDEEKALHRRAQDFAVRPGQGDVRNPYLHSGAAVLDSTGLPNIDLEVTPHPGPLGWNQATGARLHKERVGEMYNLPPSARAPHTAVGTGMHPDGTLPPDTYTPGGPDRLEVRNGVAESVLTEDEELELYYKRMAELPEREEGEGDGHPCLREPRFLGLNGAFGQAGQSVCH